MSKLLKNKKISFVIPIFNEIDSVLNLLETIKQINIKLKKDISIEGYEFILVDDGSNDGTNKFLKSHINLYDDSKNIKLITHFTNYGYGAAIQSGVYKAKYDWICTFDADGQHDIDSIMKIICVELFSNRAFLLIGTRNKNKQKNVRSIAKKLLNWSEIFLLGSRLNDSNSGLKCFNKYIFLELEKIIFAPSDMSFSQHISQTFHVLSKFAIQEVSISTNNRLNGHSKIRPKDFFIALKQNFILSYSLKPRRFFYILALIMFTISINYSAIIISINNNGMPVAGGVIFLIGFYFIILGELSNERRSNRLQNLKAKLRIKYFLD